VTIWITESEKDPMEITHELITITKGVNQERPFVGSSLTGQASFELDEFDFLTLQISPHDALGNFRLAHIFQAQSEHETAF
jgi:hypothetical protein